MKSFKLSRVFLSLLLGFSFLLPLIGLVGFVLGNIDGGHEGGGGGP